MPAVRTAVAVRLSAATTLLLCACGSDAVTTATPTPSGGAAAACTPAPAGGDSFTQQVPLTTAADGLKYGDIVTGTGAQPHAGDTLTVQYTGWLTNGCVFDTSRQPGRQPFSFVIGANPPNVIAGWDQGVLTMRVGGKRRLVIPPSLGYGSQAQGPIPANSTLVFDVELLSDSGASATPTP